MINSKCKSCIHDCKQKDHIRVIGCPRYKQPPKQSKPPEQLVLKLSFGSKKRAQGGQGA
ncbi:hypothetical protein C7459_1277 [Tumebacillus permanentifrigoris]|uniref:Uncharacterized protein n=1 Tax=Tumebacillus permanentifrigoris TaxID=378543 RepID=A0A316DPP4_9BACL|nr:hypothetical protein C7459_1277 [Tumebacillus permanentifrigoris]